MRDRWQYRMVNLGSFFTAQRLPEALGRLGSEGWELVHVYDKASNWMRDVEKGFALFKRPVPAGEPDPIEGWCVVDGKSPSPGFDAEREGVSNEGWM
jgi:hypothetical protein